MKKILNLIASISLVATGASSVIACGSPINSDQNLVNDVVKKLQGKTFAVNEDKKGDHNFSEYKDQVLQEVKQDLSSNEKGLVSFLDSEDQKAINAEQIKNINLHIQSNSVITYINISVKLNYDAQSIAQKINNQTFGVREKRYQAYQVKNYETEIKQQISNSLTTSEKTSGYLILTNWSLYNLKWTDSIDIPIQIQIGEDLSSKVNINLVFKYMSEKAILDDPRNRLKGNAIPFAMGLAQTIPPSDWPKDGVVDLLNGAWESMGGLVPELYNDVVYNQKTLIKGTAVPLTMYFKDGVFDYDINHPLSFWVKGH